MNRSRRREERTGEGDLLLVTQMVADKPREDVERVWEKICPADAEETVRVVGFKRIGEADFEAVPDIVYLLIFRLRELSLGASDHNDAVHWQKGLLVKDGYGNAGRIELEGNYLRIRVRHRLVPGLMHTVIHRIGVSGDGYWNGRGLEQIEFVVCGNLCPNRTPERGLVAIEDCLEDERCGILTIRCRTCRSPLSIRALLNQQPVESGKSVELRQWLEPHLADVLQGQERLLREVREQGESTRRQIADLGDSVRMQGDAVLDAFTSEWKDGPRLFSLLPIPGNRWNPRDWVEMQFRITVWCESSRRPVPVLHVPGSVPRVSHIGTEIVTLPCEWIVRAGRILKWSQWAIFALATGGVGGVGALVSATGGVITNADAKALAGELAEQLKAFKELADALPRDEALLSPGESGRPAVDWLGRFGTGDRQAFGTPLDGDKKLIGELRTLFRTKDPDWGGLKCRDDGTFRRIWAHPSV